MSNASMFPSTPPPFPVLPRQQAAQNPNSDENVGISDLEPFIITLDKLGNPELAAEIEGKIRDKVREMQGE